LYPGLSYLGPLGAQARSAWVESPVPEGRSKSLSVPEIFVVETEFMPL
jgi:hypothetical protein